MVLTVGAVAGLPLDTGAGVWPNGRLCGGLSGSMKTIFLTKEGGGKVVFGGVNNGIHPPDLFASSSFSPRAGAY